MLALALVLSLAVIAFVLVELYKPATKVVKSPEGYVEVAL